MPSFSHLTIEHRRAVSGSRLWCILHSSIAFLGWSIALLFTVLAMSPPLDNPAGLGLYIVALFVLAFPFGAANALITYSIVLKYNDYVFSRTRDTTVICFVASTAFALAWYVVIRSNPTLWQYTGLLWLLWTIFVPSAMVGVATTAYLFAIAKDAG